MRTRRRSLTSQSPENNSDAQPWISDFEIEDRASEILSNDRLIARLERVDQVKLQTVQVRLDLTHLYACSFYGILQIGVQSASVPPGKAGDGVAAQLPEGINAMLQNIGRCSLIAFRE